MVGRLWVYLRVQFFIQVKVFLLEFDGAAEVVAFEIELPDFMLNLPIIRLA